MTTTRAVQNGNGEIVRGQQKPETSLIGFIEKHTQDFARVLPKHMTPERMVRLAISAVRTTPKLGECSIASFASSLMACSALGLEPNTPLGHAYLIPRWSSKLKGQECTLIVGYKGLIDLMYRSGFVANIKAEPVFAGDKFEYEKGLSPVLRHVPQGEDDPSKLTHIYTIVRWKDGGEPIWDVLTLNQILRRRNRGGYDESRPSPWKSDFVEMAQKSGVRAIAKWAPTSTERVDAGRAIAYEDARELGMGARAIAALGPAAQEGLEAMGAFPTDDETITADGEIISSPSAAPMREPGED